MPEVVVAGAGPAGCAAAVQCRRLGLDVLLIDRTGRPGGLAKNAFSIENCPGFERPLPGKEYTLRLGRILEKFDIEVEQDTLKRAAHLSDGLFEIETAKKNLSVSNLIVATGTEPVQLDMKGAGILAEEKLLFSEVSELLECFVRPREVVVAGGGEASYDYALSLHRAGARVKIICRSQRRRVFGRLLKLVECKEEIEVARGVVPVAARKKDGGVELELQWAAGQVKNSFMYCDALIAAIGRIPSLPNLAAKMEWGDSSSILTPCPGLFICGDARLKSLGQVGIATGDGLEAAMASAKRIRSEN